ncbi:MAG: hypothetical protein ABII79_00530 [bacterium]
MKRLALLLISGVLVVIALSCASDIYLEDPFSLKGNYDGWYIITVLSEPQVVDSQRIIFRFGETDYNLWIDSTHEEVDSSLCICHSYGTWKLKNRVELTQSGAVGHWAREGKCMTCLQDWSPQGAFALRTPGDTVELTRTNTDLDPDLFMRLLLLPKR